MNNVEIDKSNVDRLLSQLSKEKTDAILTKALRKGAKVLQDNTKLQLRSKLGQGATSGKRFGKSLESGIKVKADGYGEISVHIMGDFRLKFFEKGIPKNRITRKTKANRGTIDSLQFFKTARQDERSINNAVFQSISKSLKKI